ncbi:hypothetical protein ASD54_21865 [Rhizobium sp. Root149]|uniref:YciI family protein n=1 Tax=Rhizobium sp. Root149 TaxID=1736473 RepID=UPI00071453A4|nr:YciI family protein [Rhizobium sp. Root149]KQZ46661.1 hypothetical protein ASD54_21865 [Rhizobium sp. Root149]
MAFMIFTRDRSDGASIRDACRAEHYRYLQANAHLLVASGGLLNDSSAYSGGLILLNVATMAEAEAFIAGDPFTREGLFGEVILMPWVPAFLDGKQVPKN